MSIKAIETVFLTPQSELEEAFVKDGDELDEDNVEEDIDEEIKEHDDEN